jgi:DNA topoisomerase-1
VDSQGRIKRFYTPESEALRQKQKFERIRVLSGKLSDLDRTLREEAGVDDRAAVAMLVRATGMRPGSESKTGGAKQAFGATTLQAQHVTIDGDLVSFDFIGKNGKTIQFETHNRVLAAALEPHLEGKSGSDQVFQNVNEKNVNAYLKGVLGDEFKTKDLRTVLATATARARVDEIDPEDIHDLKPAERKRLRTEICTEISERLGNTPAEVQKSYVDPGVWDALGL